APNGPNSSRVSTSVSSTSATVTVGTMNETVNVTLLYGTAIGSLSSESLQTDFNESQVLSLSSLTASTLHHFNVTICDFNGNCVKNGTFNFTTSAAAAAEAAAASTSSGASGGGAAAASAVEASAGRQWDSLAAGSSGVLAINNEKIAVTGVVIDVKNAVTSPSITVESLTSNPLSATAAAKVYQYLNLKKSNIADSDASKITVNFRVSKSWLSSNGVADSDIVLWRYSGGNWNKLETKLVSSDGSFANYEAVTPGFSTFAIGNKEAGTSAFAIIDMIRDFYAGTSTLTAFDIIDQIRSFYGG
ncbi:MAG TPA: PGF-pre-PGF domain-containing protein, partial [Candidatus Nanoarchaeia archaeon]|nr:PGF-pre-PGF domain-containing protein [Candidatus Woesearchaeota archaeon]HLD18706.1 PGF-pre-PGF domain-containing protein [Candidatus Nanoarchaeia archaeon]